MHHAIVRWFISLSAFCAALFISSCELATNPLLFDGSPLSANFTVIVTGNSFSGSNTIHLSDVFSGIDIDIDSVSVINVSILIDSLSNGAVGSTTISGTGSVDGHALLTLSGVALSTFSSERSIFDPTLSGAGVTYGSAGISYINSMLRHPESLPSSTSISVSGTTSQNGRFKAHIKFYTQVFTHP